MKVYLDIIDREFTVRNSAAQKEAFRRYVLSEADKMNVPARVETDSKHSNIVLGDPSSARAVFTAHYDTPRRAVVPNLMLVTNKPLQILYVFSYVLPILFIALGAARGIEVLTGLTRATAAGRAVWMLTYLAVYIGLFIFLIFGPANKHNRNDNTSGTALVMELACRLGADRGAAFILFDDEEKGKLGSKAYAKAHPELKDNALVINFDCVGNGDNLLFTVPEGADALELYKRLEALANGQSALHARFLPAAKASMNSDHKSFKYGMGVCACAYKRLVGYYCGRIHTGRDTVADENNLSCISDIISGLFDT